MAGHWLVEVFVRRGALRRFDAFRRKTRGLPVIVRWDRRANDGQRSTGEPERRQEPPFTWETAGFVVVERPQTAEKE